METKTLPKKPTTNAIYAESAREYVKAKRDDAGGAKPFFKLVHGREPIDNESITFNNQVNRGNYSAEFVGLLVDRLGWDDVPMGVFYKPNQ